MSGTLAILRDVGTALVKDPKRDSTLVQSVVGDVERVVVMLNLDKSNIKQLSSAVARADSHAKNGSEGGSISPLAVRLLKHDICAQIVENARAFVQQNNVILRHDVQKQGWEHMFTKTVQVVKQIFSKVTSADSDAADALQEWEVALEKASDNTTKMREKFEQDLHTPISI